MAVEYFEIDLMPGRRFFRCEPLRASISTDECERRWRAGNMLAEVTAEKRAGLGGSIDADFAQTEASTRCLVCKGCGLGARHAGVPDANPSLLRGQSVCARCHRGATRLIGRRICISCYNRQRELFVGKNSKGTKPVKLAALDRRQITYVTAGEVKTLALERSADMDELVVSVLRDEPHSVRFIPTLPARFLELRALEGA
ncbi:hypothetical protein AB4Y32_24105 [Paraburkholderia phymatum]|uniref:Uncharacterized protein n=1 Tax=Paraburkholderia phymatum TaxID=148447 RepID=A0ACC6U5G6_9BURK